MKLVTPFKGERKTPEEYIPGKCNIGARGRAMRLATGLVVIGLTAGFGLVLLPSPSFRVPRLALALPIYVGLLSILEGGMSFCVFHAARGTYDFHEKLGPIGSSPTKMRVELDEWRRKDRRKALLMHLEAISGAVLLAILLFLSF